MSEFDKGGLFALGVLWAAFLVVMALAYPEWIGVFLPS